MSNMIKYPCIKCKLYLGWLSITILHIGAPLAPIILQLLQCRSARKHTYNATNSWQLQVEITRTEHADKRLRIYLPILSIDMPTDILAMFATCLFAICVCPLETQFCFLCSVCVCLGNKLKCFAMELPSIILQTQIEYNAGVSRLRELLSLWCLGPTINLFTSLCRPLVWPVYSK